MKDKKTARNKKAYNVWRGMIDRCFDEKVKNTKKALSYKDASCCEEWLSFENFYDWLSNQENFDKWLTGNRWNLDKDIIIKGNKVYSPETCCLVPNYVNVLFTKSSATRGDLPIGVHYNKGRYIARVSMRGNDDRCTDSGRYRKHLGGYSSPEEAFMAYKKEKEEHIKQVAQEEYDKGNITKKCYDAMMSYKVEIDD